MEGFCACLLGFGPGGYVVAGAAFVDAVGARGPQVVAVGVDGAGAAVVKGMAPAVGGSGVGIEEFAGLRAVGSLGRMNQLIERIGELVELGFESLERGLDHGDAGLGGGD